MDRACIHKGIRRIRFEDALGRTERSGLSQIEAAGLLEISGRTFRAGGTAIGRRQAKVTGLRWHDLHYTFALGTGAPMLSFDAWHKTGHRSI